MSIKTFVTAVMVIAVSPTAVVGQATAADEAAVRAVVDGFGDALKAGEGEKALAYLHPAIRIFEGGHAETHAEYASGHLRGDMAFAAAVDRNTTWSEVSVEGDVAMYLSEYTTTGTFRDREIDSHGTETVLLRRTSDGWKIRHVHWSSR